MQFEFVCFEEFHTFTLLTIAQKVRVRIVFADTHKLHNLPTHKFDELGQNCVAVTSHTQFT